MKNYYETIITMNGITKVKDYGEWGTINKEWLAKAQHMTDLEILEEVLDEAERNCLYPSDLAFANLVAYHLDIDFNGTVLVAYWKTAEDFRYGAPRFRVATDYEVYEYLMEAEQETDSNEVPF